MPSPSDPGPPAPEPFAASDIRRQVLNRIGAGRRAPAELLKELAHDLRLPRERLQAGLRELVAAGELSYVCEHGRTFLEPSFDRPVRVSDRIVLIPPGRIFRPRPADAVIRIMPGAAFGAGRHPTTRLALKGIDFVLGRWTKALTGPARRVLDIGAGSGVLVMAALKLGIESGLAVDIDPGAVAEARANLELNGLGRRVVVCDRAAEAIEGRYALVTANLRTPTLARLAPCIAGYCTPRGALVLSGIRIAECGELLSAFETHFFNTVWREEECEGLALTRKC
jgi:ribosomal protein L11 methyltransferase